METHDHDPRADEPSDPWQQASERFSSIGSKLRDRYAEIVGEDGPAEDDVRDAIKTIGTAAQSMIESIGVSMRDPEVREQLKDASSTFFSAVGQTLSELGEELRKAQGQEKPPSPPQEERPSQPDADL